MWKACSCRCEILNKKPPQGGFFADIYVIARERSDRGNPLTGRKATVLLPIRYLSNRGIATPCSPRHGLRRATKSIVIASQYDLMRFALALVNAGGEIADWFAMTTESSVDFPWFS